jgi:hypothetical protein
MSIVHSSRFYLFCSTQLTLNVQKHVTFLLLQVQWRMREEFERNGRSLDLATNQSVVCLTYKYVDGRKSCPNWRFTRIPHRTVLRIAPLHISAHSYTAVFDLCVFYVIAIYPNIETIFGFVRYFLFSPEQVLGTAHQSSACADFKNTCICTLAPLLLLCGVVAWSVTHINFSDRRKSWY